MTYKRVDYSGDDELDSMQEILDLGEFRAQTAEIVKMAKSNPDSISEKLIQYSDTVRDSIILELEDKGFYVDSQTLEVTKSSLDI